MIQQEVVGKVEEITSTDKSSHLITISYNPDVTGGELNQFLNVLWGNVSLFPNVRIVDLKLPDSFLAKFSGPRFGISGLRELLGAETRPLVSTALKPMGSDAQTLAEMARTLALAGFDLIKDDHSLANQPWATWKERLDEYYRRHFGAAADALFVQFGLDAVGDDVHHATHGRIAVEERGGSTHGLDAVHQEGFHRDGVVRAVGRGVEQREAVLEDADALAIETAHDRPAGARPVVRVADARFAAERGPQRRLLLEEQRASREYGGRLREVDLVAFERGRRGDELVEGHGRVIVRRGGRFGRGLRRETAREGGGEQGTAEKGCHGSD